MEKYAAVYFWGVEANSFYSMRNRLNFRYFKNDCVVRFIFFELFSAEYEKVENCRKKWKNYPKKWNFFKNLSCCRRQKLDNCYICVANKGIMSIIAEIRKTIGNLPENHIFSASYFSFSRENPAAVVKSLNRMVQAGEIAKISKGKFYKPRKSQFGVLSPTPYQIAKEFIEKDGKMVGYMTGYSAFRGLGLTTQISSYIHIGTNQYRRPVQRENYTIIFIKQNNSITRKNNQILVILDALKFIREIPGTTPDAVCFRVKEIIKSMPIEMKDILARCCLKYTCYVRALCGAILEELDCSAFLLDTIRGSLNTLTEYRLPISESTLPTKSNWKIYEPARK